MIGAARLRTAAFGDLRRTALCAAANAELCRAGRGLGAPAAAPRYERERRQVEDEMLRRIVGDWTGA